MFDKPVVFSLHGSGVDTIHDLATDADGDIYVTGSTSSLDLPVKNAAQPAVGESQVMRSTDRGATWTSAGNAPTADPLAIAAGPASPDVLFVGTKEGIFKSADGGRTWRMVYRMPPTPSGIGVSGLVIDPGNPARLAAIAGDAGVLASADHGESWAVTMSGGSLYGSSTDRLIMDPSGSGAVLFLSTGSLRISRDAGRTWQPLHLPPPPGFPQAAAFDPHHPGWIYLSSAAGTLGRFFLSTDTGATWTETTSPRSAIYSDLLADPDRPDVLYAAALDGVYRSDDAGSSWQGPLRGLTGRLAVLPAACGGGALVAIVNYDLSASLDGGATWSTPALTQLRGVAIGADCAIYALRAITSDAFVAKVSPDGGQTLWFTYLGGGRADAASFVALDGSGNVYVAGATQSPDFPATVERLGAPGLIAIAFVTKFDAQGRLVYSTVFGGVMELRGLAVDRGGNAYLAGEAVNPGPGAALVADLPVTPGALQTEPGGGFLVKLAPDGGRAYATYLPEKAGAVAVDPQGRALAGTATGRLLRLDPAGSRIEASLFPAGELDSPYAQDPLSAMQVDPEGNVYVAGSASQADFAASPGAFSSGLRSGSCRTSPGPAPAYPPGDLFVMKLRAGGLQPVYAALLGGECWSGPQRLLVDAQGAVTVTGRTIATAYPLRGPELGPVCDGVLSRLGAEGSLLYSSRLCGGPAAAFAPGGGLYVVSSGAPAGASSVLGLTVPESRDVSLDRVANAFSGSPAQIAPATLVMLSGSGLGPDPAIAMDWTSGEVLPLELGGVRVLFDGEPARLLFVSEGRILCVTPPGLKDRSVVQVVYGGKPSNAMGIAAAPAAPALLTRTFPDAGIFNFALLYPGPDPGDVPAGFALNQDGSWNDAAHPAAPGSTVTVFATGLGVTSPPLDPGAPAPGDAAQPARIYGYWSSLDRVASVESASTADGLIAAVHQVRVKIPDVQPREGAERLVLLLLTQSTDFFSGVRFIPFSAWSNPAVIYVAAGN